MAFYAWHLRLWHYWCRDIFLIGLKSIKASIDGTMNLGGTWGITHHLFISWPLPLCISGSAYDAVYDELRAHDQVVLFPASFTFMIKARTKMDKACNGAKIKAALWWYDDDNWSHLCITKEKVWALNMLDYVCSSCWRGARRLFALNVYVACHRRYIFLPLRPFSDLERPICLPDCARVDIIVSHYFCSTSLDTT